MKFLLMVASAMTMFTAVAQADYTCTTQSQGRRFVATAATENRAINQVVRACTNDRVTRARQCERNVECREDRRRPQPPPRDRDRDERRDGQCYLNRYPDICQNSPNNFCRDPRAHYERYGRAEGRIWGCR